MGAPAAAHILMADPPTRENLPNDLTRPTPRPTFIPNNDLRASHDRPFNEPLSRAGYVQKASIDADPTRLLMAYPGYGRQPAIALGYAVQGSRAHTQWNQEMGVWVHPGVGAPPVTEFLSEDAAWGFASGTGFNHHQPFPGTAYNGVRTNSAAGARTTAGWHFPNITIPNGATIVSASVTVKRYDILFPDDSEYLFAVLGFEDSDDALSFDDDGQIASRALVGSGTIDINGVGDPDTGGDGFDYTFDVTEMLQDMVDRGGWASGNAIMWLMQGKSQDEAANQDTFLAYKGIPGEFGDAYPARLTVTT